MIIPNHARHWLVTMTTSIRKSVINVIVLPITLSLFYMSNSQAALINFDTLTSGDFLTTQFQSLGAIFDGRSGAGEVINVSAGEHGVLDFGGSLPNAVLMGGTGVEITFVLPGGQSAVTDFVSLRMGDGDAQSERFIVSFFDIAGNLLTFIDTTTTSGAVNGGATVSYSGGGIHSLTLQMQSSSPSGAVFDDLSFNSVQAVTSPAILWLLLAGVSGLFIRERTRTR